MFCARKFDVVTKGFRYVLAAVFAAEIAFATFGFGIAWSQPPAAGEGLRVFKSANCMGCHKWSGVGGGGYGGAAANLRGTSLSLEQIELTIRCGRPATGMPHFEADAYSSGGCYGMKQADLPAGQMPPEPDHPLRPEEIRAVAEYVVNDIKGKGDPTFAQCQAFFGTGTRVCDTYAGADAGKAQAASAPSGKASFQHLEVEAAPDANAGKNSPEK